MKDFDLQGLSRDELTDLLQKVMVRLRYVDAEEIKNNFVTKSQRLRLEEAIKNQIKQREGQA